MSFLRHNMLYFSIIRLTLIIIYINSIDKIGDSEYFACVKANSTNSFLVLSSRFSRLLPFLFARSHHVQSTIMKKTNRSHSPSESSHRGGTACQAEGRWSFNLASERLFAFGSTASGKRGAYLTAQGEVRVLSL